MRTRRRRPVENLLDIARPATSCERLCVIARTAPVRCGRSICRRRSAGAFDPKRPAPVEERPRRSITKLRDGKRKGERETL